MKRLSQLTPLEKQELHDYLSELLSEFIIHNCTIEEDIKKIRINNDGHAVFAAAMILALKETL